ncbi:hypothetical protein B0H10DRAFT_2221139 [Mycena sp. CBHHK59/15]|nr:hypothetical protein B0H10DRAFT_2221139 [Mycena sp. CBHHK59/15]
MRTHSSSSSTNLPMWWSQKPDILVVEGFSLLGKDYPALIKHDETSIVDGLLLCPCDKSQRKKVDDFEGEAFIVTPVQVAIVGEEGEMVDADIYLWNGETDAVATDRWELDTFIWERLDDWIDLFAGMELVGDDEDASQE